MNTVKLVNNKKYIRMNKSRQTNQILLPRSNKHLYSSMKTKTLRNAKSGVVIAQPKLQKTKIANQSYYRKNTVHSGARYVEESQHSKGKHQAKCLKNCKVIQEQRLTKRLMSASADPRKMLYTLRSTSPSLQIISAQLEMKKTEKSVRRREQHLIDRLSLVLEEYKQTLTNQRKEKQYLLRENRRLKERLYFQSSQKKINPINQYNL